MHLRHVLQEEQVEWEEPALWLLGRAAAGSMRDALSLTDQAIAFGSGAVRESEVRAMLGSVDLSFVYRLLEAVIAGEPATALQVVAQMAEHAPDFEASLDELISLLHRVAIAQAVPDAVDNSWGDAERVAAIGRSLTAEDTQLYYQMALNGKRDIALAGDPRSGFEMVALRMMAFRPEAAIDSPESAADSTAVAPEVDPQPKKPTERRAAQAATVAAQPAAAAGRLAGLDPADWPSLMPALGLGGALENIAANCELRSVNGSTLELVLDEDAAGLFNPARHPDMIRRALENYFGEALRVELAPGVVRCETPAARRQRLAAERQAEAVEEIEADPRLRSLIERFDGELDRASIKPLDS